MVDIQVNYDTEQVKATTKHKFVAPRWIVRMTEDQSDTLRKKYQELVSAKKLDRAHRLVMEDILSRMTYRKLKDSGFDSTTLMFEETLLAIAQAWKEKVGIKDEVA